MVGHAVTNRDLEILNCLCDKYGLRWSGIRDKQRWTLASNAELRYLIDTYLDWAKRQQVPIVEGIAIDLNNNPTFGQILNQVRGEKIDWRYETYGFVADPS
jgi:hypothetical protein